MPDGSHLDGYMDEVVALIAARAVEQAQHTLGMVQRGVSIWIIKHEFTLALKKTQVVVELKGKGSRKVLPIPVGEIIVEAGDEIPRDYDRREDDHLRAIGGCSLS